MTRSTELIQNVPTSIITGFLGVGKTTAILNLLRSKPAEQKWAVLVNEFGEIGVDGSLMQGQQSESQGVFISEVPGGCMCCTAGLPMQVALNQLLITARPDRLLIEPTGLGHPKEVLQVLTRSISYQTALNVQRTIALVNACQLNDSRYTENDIFNQQIEIADVIVANKTDLYQPGDKETLLTHIAKHNSINAEVLFTINGKFEPSVLPGASQYTITQTNDHSSSGHHHAEKQAYNALPDCGYIKKQNHGDGFFSVGWQFREDIIFNRKKLFSLLSGIDAERVKAVMNTENGVYGYNKEAESLTEIGLFSSGRSCIEVISREVDDSWETQLLQCVESQEPVT